MTRKAKPSRKPLDDSKLEVVETHIYPDGTCDETGKLKPEYVEIGTEETRTLERGTARVFISSTVRHKVILKSDIDLAEDYKKVEKDSAKTLVEFMSTMIKRNNNAVQAPQMQILNDSVHGGDTPSIEVRQIGDHPVYIGNINGDVHFGA